MAAHCCADFTTTGTAKARLAEMACAMARACAATEVPDAVKTALPLFERVLTLV